MLCKITLEHSLLAMAMTVVVALLVAGIGAYRPLISSLRRVCARREPDSSFFSQLMIYGDCS
jgi:hypothetical protein